MTLVTRGSDRIIEQITKQLNKLVDVVKLTDLVEAEHIERELMMVKVRAEGDAREEAKRLSDIFRGNIIDVTPKTYVIEITGTSCKHNHIQIGTRHDLLEMDIEAVRKSKHPTLFNIRFNDVRV